MLNSSETYNAWELMEDVVIRDRDCDEEACLARVIQSYLYRRGLADTLTAFNADLEEAHSSRKCCVPPPISSEAQHRKDAQLLCLNGRYREVAELLPEASVLRVKLLCLAALGQDDSDTSLPFLVREVAPLVPISVDPVAANTLYLGTVATILGDRPLTTMSDIANGRRALALEVNEELLNGNEPSSLNVMLSWLDNQQQVLPDL